MKCPFCHAGDSEVIDSRTSGDAIRRRRKCKECGKRFTTHERCERPILWVVKKDGRKQPYSRAKILAGIELACRKRNLDPERYEEAIQRIEADLNERFPAEIPSTAVGEAVLAALKDLDEVAYVRFASVYRQFDSVEKFIETVRPLRERA